MTTYAPPRPRPERPANPAAGSQSSAGPEPHGLVAPIRVLLVETCEMDYLVVRALLAQYRGQFVLDRIEDFDSALAAMTQPSYDVFLLDNELGDRTGVELLEAARRSGVRAPAIVFTGRGNPEVDRAAMRAGAADYLVKGQVDGATLERSIRYSVEWSRTLDRLQESERFLESALDALSTRIAILADDGTIIAVNAAWRRDPADPAVAHAIGDDYLGACAARASEGAVDGHSVSDGIRAVMRGTTPRFERECWFSREADGRWFNVCVTPFVGSGPTRVVVAHEDVTERKLAERALLEREEQLRQSQKMGAVGRLAGGVAHDFNNLLTAIRGYNELLLSKLDDDSGLRREAGEIKKAAERASLLTERLLAFGRREVVQPTVLDLNAVVADVSHMLERLIGENIELNTRLTPGVHAVRADPGQIEQVLMNLVVNARDAMPGGGEIVIETGEVELGELRPDPELVPGRYVCLRVIDTGMGIDSETRSHLFEPFFTTKPPGAGTGLGLSTVYGIVKQSRGWIGVESTVGSGTTFEILLARTDEHVELIEPDAVLPVDSVGTERILIVEDEPGVRSLVTEVLEINGYDVLVAAAGPEALEISDAHPDEQIDLLITDVVMPEMGGRELAERMLVRRDGLKVLFVSGYTEDEVLREGVERCDVAFLQKPFTVTSLITTVRQILDGEHPAVARPS